ncbi:hypothetical protein HKX48_006294 [Thoreauomyces humboldtii]|nr:hypothetical protein HKX48_006294 [Thoreauomyces humboldtii]
MAYSLIPQGPLCGPSPLRRAPGEELSYIVLKNLLVKQYNSREQFDTDCEQADFAVYVKRLEFLCFFSRSPDNNFYDMGVSQHVRLLNAGA